MERPARPATDRHDGQHRRDGRLSLREFREFFGGDSGRRAVQLLSGAYVLDPWVRVRMGDDWMITAGIEVSREQDDGA